MNKFIHILSLLLLLCNIPAYGQEEQAIPCKQPYNPDAVLQGGALYGTVKDGITKTGFEIDFTIDGLFADYFSIAGYYSGASRTNHDEYIRVFDQFVSNRATTNVMLYQYILSYCYAANEHRTQLEMLKDMVIGMGLEPLLVYFPLDEIIAPLAKPISEIVVKNYARYSQWAGTMRVAQKGGVKTVAELRSSLDEWVRLQRELAPSKTQLEKFNTATVVYDKSTGKYYYGSNKGITFKGDNINNGLFDKLPESSLNEYKLGNCAECDGVNQALNDGAKWNNLQMHTIGIDVKTGQTFSKPLCENCEYTFKGIEIVN